MFGYYRDYRDKCLNYRDITFSIIAQLEYVYAKVHNIIEEESILHSNILYKHVLQSYDATVISVK